MQSKYILVFKRLLLDTVRSECLSSLLSSHIASDTFCSSVCEFIRFKWFERKNEPDELKVVWHMQCELHNGKHPRSARLA